MVALISFLLVVTLSLIVERVTTVALLFVGAPHNAIVIRPRGTLRGTLVLYGRAEPLAQISGRRSGAGGDLAHCDAVHTHRQVVQDQDQRDHAWQVRWRHRYERPLRPADSPPPDAHESSSAGERADGWLQADVRQPHARAHRRTDAGTGAAGPHLGGSQSPLKGEGEGPEPSPHEESVNAHSEDPFSGETHPTRLHPTRSHVLGRLRLHEEELDYGRHY